MWCIRVTLRKGRSVPYLQHSNSSVIEQLWFIGLSHAEDVFHAVFCSYFKGEQVSVGLLLLLWLTFSTHTQLHSHLHIPTPDNFHQLTHRLRLRLVFPKEEGGWGVSSFGHHSLTQSCCDVEGEGILFTNTWLWANPRTVQSNFFHRLNQPSN